MLGLCRTALGGASPSGLSFLRGVVVSYRRRSIGDPSELDLSSDGTPWCRRGDSNSQAR